MILIFKKLITHVLMEVFESSIFMVYIYSAAYSVCEIRGSEIETNLGCWVIKTILSIS